jgi:hypothetical protein
LVRSGKRGSRPQSNLSGRLAAGKNVQERVDLIIRDVSSLDLVAIRNILRASGTKCSIKCTRSQHELSARLAVGLFVRARTFKCKSSNVKCVAGLVPAIL